MDIVQRKVTIITSLGKKYSGMIDIPRAGLRTTDLFNSTNIFWKNPNEKCYDNAIHMYNVRLVIDESLMYKNYEKIQIKLSEVLYFYDDLLEVGDKIEKNRATTMIRKTLETIQTVNIITRAEANSFYDITGSFHGLFKKKTNDKFIPLTNAKIVAVYKKEEKWCKRELSLPHEFIGVSNSHIESVTIERDVVLG